MADLRRLASLAGIESDDLIKCAFVVGLPPDVSSQLRTFAQIQKLPLSDIANQARILLAEGVYGRAMVAVDDKRNAKCV